MSTKPRDSYTVEALKEIMSLLHGTVGSEAAMHKLRRLIANTETFAKENRETRRKWVRQFAEHVLAAQRSKERRNRYYEKPILGGAWLALAAIHERSRRWHASRAGDFARSLIDG